MIILKLQSGEIISIEDISIIDSVTFASERKIMLIEGTISEDRLSCKKFKNLIVKEHLISYMYQEDSEKLIADIDESTT